MLDKEMPNPCTEISCSFVSLLLGTCQTVLYDSDIFGRCFSLFTYKDPSRDQLVVAGA